MSPPPESRRVEVRIGHADGKHVRMKGAQIEAPERSNGLLSGTLTPGWARLYVLAYSAGGKARLFVFEPDLWGALAWRFGDFYIRGPAREVEHDNNPRRARELFDQIGKE